MRVKDLIVILQRMPPDASIVMHDMERSSHYMLQGAGELRGVVHLTPTQWVRPSMVLVKHREGIISTLASFRLSRPRVFGSVLSGTDTELSDLDLLVDPHQGTTLLDIAGAVTALNKLLGISVDLMTPGDLPEKWCDQVLMEAKPL